MNDESVVSYRGATTTDAVLVYCPYIPLARDQPRVRAPTWDEFDWAEHYAGMSEEAWLNRVREWLAPRRFRA
jgi:hypothetical protein